MSRCGPDERPYELTLPRPDFAGAEQNLNFQDDQQRKQPSQSQKLSEIFMSDENIWKSIF